MKKLFLTVPLLAINFAVASQQIVITGIGSNKVEAKENALANASATYCGTAVVSNKVFKDRKTVRNDVVTSSSCIIQNSKVIKEETVSDQIKITMQITLVTLPISERILSENNQYTFPNGENWNTQIQSYNKNLRDRDKLLNQVLSDFPYYAFNVKEKNAFIYFDNRKSYFVVPYIINWNPNYLTALNSTLKLVGKEVRTDRKLDYGYPIRFSNQYRFRDKKFYISDYRHFEIIKKKMQNEPYIHLSLEMIDGSIIKNCAPVITKNNIQVGDFYHFSIADFADINTYQTSEKAFYIDTEKYNINPEKIMAIELKIVSFADCNNY